MPPERNPTAEPILETHVLVKALLAAEHIRNAAVRAEQDCDLRQGPVSTSLSETKFVMARLLFGRATLLL
jgi:hypothetical protein